METGGGGREGWQDVSKVGYAVRHEQHIEILEHIRKFYCYKSVVFPHQKGCLKHCKTPHIKLFFKFSDINLCEISYQK